MPKFWLRQKKAEAIAQSVRDDADAGVFGGEGEIPAALPNPFAITVNGISYDGSEPVEVNIETDMTAYYTKTETDEMFKSYITDVDVLIGGDE